MKLNEYARRMKLMIKEGHDFWLVWNPEGREPQRRHGDYATALAEAKRLATSNPGKRFYVVRPVAVALRAEPVQVTVFCDPDDMLPF